MIDIGAELDLAYAEMYNAAVSWRPSDGSATVTGYAILDGIDAEIIERNALNASYTMRVPYATFSALTSGECLTVADAEPSSLEGEYRIVSPPQRINDGAEYRLSLTIA